MRLALLLLLLAAGPVRAEGGTAGCLDTAEMRDAVEEKAVIAPPVAVMVARRAVPGAEVIRARLCRSGEGMAYLISALREDGRLVQVVVDAPTGKVVAVH